MTKTNRPKMYRQGDVLLVATGRPTADLTEVQREGDRIVLAHGEATGHAHAIDSINAVLLMDAVTLDRYLDVRAPVIIGHEEHSPIELPGGFYHVRRQREYRPEGLRNVAD